MKRLTVELIPDAEQGGFTARVPDIPAYGEGETEDEAIAGDEVCDSGHPNPYRRCQQMRQHQRGEGKDGHIEHRRAGHGAMESRPADQRDPYFSLAPTIAPGEALIEPEVHLHRDEEGGPVRQEVGPAPAEQDAEQRELHDGAHAAGQREPNDPATHRHECLDASGERLAPEACGPRGGDGVRRVAL